MLLRLLKLAAILIVMSYGNQAIAKDYYWIGGTGSWSNINNWATISGGSTIHVVVPATNDNVIFDANSFTGSNQIVTIDVGNATCHDMDWMGAKFTPRLEGGEVRMTGSLTLIPQMAVNLTGAFRFESVSLNETIVFANHTLPDVYFNGVGASWTVQDDLNMSGKTLHLINGQVTIANKTVIIGTVLADNTGIKGIDFTNSTIALDGSGLIWDLNGINSSMDFTNAPITANGPGLNFKTTNVPIDYFDLTFSNPLSTATIDGIGSNFNRVVFASNGYLFGNNSFVDLTFAESKTYLLEQGKTQSITGDWIADGICLDETIIRSSGATQANVTKTSDQDFNYVIMTGISASGAIFTAYFSQDVSDNLGITFVPKISRDLYWVGGSGNWDDISHWALISGGPGGECIPEEIDDVYFDANSFTSGGQVVVLNINGECRNMDWSAASNQPTFNGSRLLQIFGDLVLSFAMTEEINRMYFSATDLGHTIKTNGTVVNSDIWFEGDGGEWTFLDEINLNDKIWYHQFGSVVTDDFDVYCSFYFSDYNNARTLTLGASNIYITPKQGSSNAWRMNGANFTLNAGTSHIHIECEENRDINFTANGATTLQFNDLSFEKDYSVGVIQGTTNFRDIVYETHGNISNSIFARNVTFEPGFTYIIEGNQYLNVSGTLTANGTCAETIEIGTTPNQIAYISKTNGPILISWVTIENITVPDTLTSGPFTVNNGIDLGNNNKGWTFVDRQAYELYWVGGDGLWNEATNWSFSSGETGNGCVPTPIDDVFFDENSFSGSNDIVTIDTLEAYCHSMDWSGSQGNPVFESKKELNIYGSLTFIEDMSIVFSKTTYFVSYELGNTISSASQIFNKGVNFDRIEGGWQFEDAFETSENMRFNSGLLNTNSQDVTAKKFICDTEGKRSLILGATQFLVTATNNAWIARRLDYILDAGTSKITLSANNANFFHKNGSTKHTYYDVEFTGLGGVSSLYGLNMDLHEVTFNSDGVILQDNNKIDILNFRPGKTYIIQAGTNQTIGETLNSNGDCSNKITIKNSPGAPANLIYAPAVGTISVNYNIISNINALGNSLFLANSSEDLGGNTGWDFSGLSGGDFYWIGGDGVWDDPLHWSASSGGPPTGNCIPGPEDDVYFDVNSFSAPGQSVTINVLDASCHSMFWTGAKFTPAFEGIGSNPMHIYGSLVLNADMNLSYLGDTKFLTAEAGHTVESFGKVFPSDVRFMGSGDWSLIDTLATSKTVSLESGQLNTAGQEVWANKFDFTDAGSPKTLMLGSSKLYATSPNIAIQADEVNLDLQPGTSTFIISGLDASINISGTLSFNNIWFTDLIGYNEVNANGSYFNYVYFFGDGKMYGSNNFDTLRFSPAHKYLLEAGETQYVQDLLHAIGNNCFKILIESNDLPNPTYISKTLGSVNSDFLTLKSIHAIGGAVFYAGIFSDDFLIAGVSTNVGWDFSSSGDYVYGLGPDTTVFLCSDLDTFGILSLNFNGGIKWIWQDGYSGDTYPAYESGKYKVTVFFADDCFTSDSMYLTIKRFIPIVPDNPIICNGDSVELEANGNRFGYDYSWNTGATDGSITVKPARTTEYSVRVKLGAYECFDTLDVLVTDPFLDFEALDVKCFGGSDGQVVANMVDGFGIIAYSWLHGITDSVADNLDTGWYFVSATDSIGCIVKDSVFINQPDILDVSFSWPDIKCAGESTIVTANGIGGVIPYSYYWGTTNPNNITAGTYEVEITDLNNCEADSTITIIEPALLSAIVSPKNINCYDDLNGGATVLPIGGVGNYSYLWESGDTSITVNNLGLGTHSVLVSDSNGCDTNISFDITANTMVDAFFELDKIEGKRPLNVNLSNLSTGAQTYLWYFSDKGIYSGQESPNYVFDTVGTYYVELIAYDTVYGCSATYQLEVRIESNPNLTTPNVFTPNGDGSNDFFYITGDDIDQLTVTIYGRWGDKVFEFVGIDEVWNGKNNNGSELPEGTYYYSLEAIDLDGNEFMQQGHVMLAR
jgi:gliding motility-associated-like protein